MESITDLLDKLGDELSTMSVDAELVIKNGEKQLMNDLDNMVEIVHKIQFAITGEWLG